MIPFKAAVDPWIQIIATCVEVAGVAVIIIGGLIAIGLFIRDCVIAARWPDSYQTLRASLGRAILLGLELLVAADIIGTIAITPSFENVGVLALIVLIRTFLSFSLEVEIEGRWPWRRGERRADDR